MQFRRLMTAYCWKKWNGQLAIWKNGKSLGTDSVTVELLEAGEKWPGKSKRIVHTYGSVKHGLQNGPRQYWQYCDHFKERWSHAVNYSRPTITLMNIMSKVMMMILLERLQHSVEPFWPKSRPASKAIEAQYNIGYWHSGRLAAEKAIRKDQRIDSCFIDFTRPSVLSDLISYGQCCIHMESTTSSCTRAGLLQQARSAVRVGRDVGIWFATPIGTKQGDPFSPTAFSTYLERIMEAIKQAEGSRISIQGQWINNLSFADDVDMLELEKDKDRMQSSLVDVSRVGEIKHGTKD